MDWSNHWQVESLAIRRLGGRLEIGRSAVAEYQHGRATEMILLVPGGSTLAGSPRFELNCLAPGRRKYEWVSSYAV
jgi:hypothetical protein